ncbi:hypothetical protein WJX74_007562 [Apatococcus lobatus]|uniref:Cytochrome P450 n=1 Tax=Apatococcus lobatus TaxID=904363 RepID=A0AAW1QJL1_9CHLO
MMLAAPTSTVHKPSMEGFTKTAVVPWIRHPTFIPAVRHIQQAVQRVHKENAEMVQHLRECQPPPASLGAHLLALTDPATRKHLSDGQLAAELATIFFAGYDTSTASIAWAPYPISIHPYIQELVAAELDALGLLRMASRPQP